jgi:excisionase family DNA binding protein
VSALRKKSKIQKRSQRVDKSATPIAAAPLQIAEPSLESSYYLPPLNTNPPWRSMSQAGLYLGLSVKTVYRLAHAGKLENYIFGKRRRVPVTAIKALLENPQAEPKKGKPFVRLWGQPPERWAANKNTARRAAVQAA